jgi:hypothetical protein
MPHLSERLYISDSKFENELIPSIRLWDGELEKYEVQRLFWFVFGSAVKSSIKNEIPSPVNPVLAAFGFRDKRPFLPKSDIDIDLISKVKPTH